MKRLTIPAWCAEKPKRSWGTDLLLFLVLLLLLQLTEGIIVGIATVIRIFLNGTDDALLSGALPEELMLVSLFSTLPATAAVLLLCRYALGLSPGGLGLTRTGFSPDYPAGIPVGIGLFAAAFGICLAVGAVRTELSPQVSPVRCLLFFAGYLLQGASEEILCRGLLMGMLLRRGKLWVGIVGNAAFFALLHLGNSGVTPLALLNILLFGILASLCVLRRGNLWCACAIHSLWNFTQGNLCGISVSGTGSQSSLLRTVPIPEKTLWNGGAFGLEGGLAVTLILTAGIIVLLFLIPGRSSRSQAARHGTTLPPPECEKKRRFS